jgi:hypothetical protein
VTLDYDDVFFIFHINHFSTYSTIPEHDYHSFPGGAW